MKKIITSVFLIASILFAPYITFSSTIPESPALFETSIQFPIAIVDTSMTLASNTLIGGQTLNAGYTCFTLDQGQPNTEYVCGIVAGKVVSAMIRGIDPLTGYTSNINLIFSHRRGADVKITDFPILTILRNIFKGTDTIPAPIAYAPSVSPINNQDLATKGYVLGVVSGGTVTTNALIESGTAGETISAGNVVYLKAADGRWYKSDADITATVDSIQLGIAEGSGTSGSPVSGGVLRRGVDTNQSGGTAGGLGYISNTPGNVATSAGTIPRVIGNFLSTTTFDFEPAYFYTLTQSQKDAMGTITVPPSGTNKFITQNELTNVVSANQLSVTLGESFTGATTPQPATLINDLFQPRVNYMNTGASPTLSDMGRNTTSGQKKAIRIIPRTNITAASINIILSKNGSPGDNAQIEIDTDSAGSPSGTPITNGTSNGISGAGLSSLVGNQQAFTFASAFSLTAGTTYWAVIERSAGLNDSNYYNIGVQTSATNGGSTSGANGDYGPFVGKTLIGGTWGQDATYNALPYIEIVPTTGSSVSAWQSDADATNDVFRSVQGFINTTAGAGTTSSMYMNGILTGFSGLVTGVDYYLSTTKGVLQANGTNVGQFVGTATSATSINIPLTKTGVTLGYGDSSISLSIIKSPYNGTILYASTGTTVPGGSLTIADQSNLTSNAYVFRVSTGATSQTQGSLSVPIRKGQYFQVSSSTGTTSIILIPQF